MGVGCNGLMCTFILATASFQFLLFIKTPSEEGMILILIVFVLIVVSFGGWFYYHKTFSQAPKKIWTYWEEPDSVSPDKGLPSLVKQRMMTWSKWNPEHKIVLLTKKTYQGFVTIPEEIRTHPALNPDHFVDLLRLWTLAEHGGVWLDPYTELHAPLEDWMFPKYAEFMGLISNHDQYSKESPVKPPPLLLASPIIACNKGSAFMKAWRDDFSEAARYRNVAEYVESRGSAVDLREIPEPITNVSRVSAQTVLQYNHYPTDTLVFHSPSSIARYLSS